MIWGPDECTPCCVAARDAAPRHLHPTGDSGVTRPLTGPPEDAEPVDVLSRSFIHSANVYSTLRTCLVLRVASEAGSAPNRTELAGHQRRTCSQHRGRHTVGPS